MGLMGRSKLMPGPLRQHALQNLGQFWGERTARDGVIEVVR
jgi:hypothetical protein